MKPLRIGLTGGIASGKSTVADLFAAKGVPVIDTDRIAHEIVEPGKPALHQLVQAFGPDILDTQGALDRKRLRSAVFADPALRRRLESILHPLIRQEVERQSANADGPYQIIVIPLLVETGADYVDRVLVVDVGEETQIQRLRARDAQTEAQARTALAAQASRAQRLARADDVIGNESDSGALAPLVEALHLKYLTLAKTGPRTAK